MKSRHLLTASCLAAAALLSGCNDDNTPPTPVVTNPTSPPVTVPPTTMSKTISEFAASLIAMVMGTTGSSSCNQAAPTDVNSAQLTDDQTAQDANSVTVNCNS